jgi:hypothetical protein
MRVNLTSAPQKSYGRLVWTLWANVNLLGKFFYSAILRRLRLQFRLEMCLPFKTAVAKESRSLLGRLLSVA